MKKTKKKESSLKFQDYSYEQAEKDESQLSNSSFGKIQSGTNTLRILPAREGEDWKLIEYKHFVPIGAQNKAIFVCPFHQTKGKRSCKTCKEAKVLQNSSSKADIASAKDLEYQKRIKLNAVDRNNEEDGPKTYDLSPGVYKELIGFRKFEGVNFTHPTEGCDVIIIRKGEGRNKTRYTVKLARENSPLHASKKVMREWIENQPELKAFIESDEDIEMRLNGEDPRDKDDRRGGPKRGGKSSKSRDDDDDDSLDDDDFDDQEDDDEDDSSSRRKSASKTSSRRPTKDEDDDDEDSDDEEEIDL